jgi:hypothetical protein
MLQDIPNPFKQFVTRNPRPSHAAGRDSSEGTALGRVIIPVLAPTVRVDVTEPGGRGNSDDGTIAARITTGPGPGEVAPPKWWANRGANLRRVEQDEDRSANDAERPR